MNEILPCVYDIRRDLIALRVKHGADTPIGHRCSNIVGLIESYELTSNPHIKGDLAKLIGRQMAELAELTSAQ